MPSKSKPALEGAIPQIEVERRAILDTLTVGVALLKDRKAVWWNRAVEQLVDVAHDGTSAYDVSRWYARAEDYAKVGAEGYPLLATGATYSIEVELKRANGEPFWARLVGRAINPAVLSEGTIWMIEDVTARRSAEQAVRSRDAQLQGILASTMDGILAVNAEGKVIQANERFYQMWGIPEGVAASGDDDRLLACALPQLRDPDAFIRKVRDLYGSADASRDELELKDGRIFERTSTPLLMDGVLAGRIWSFRDVTVRVAAETALRVSEARLAATINAIAELVFVWDESGRFVEVHCPPNVPLLAPKEAFLGKHYREVLPPEISDQLATAIDTLTGAASTTTFDYKLTLDGKETWWGASVSRRLDHAGRPWGTVAIVRDITDRKKTEQELRESHENYLGLFNTVTEAIYVHGPDGVFLDVNEGAVNMYGYSRQELIGRTPAFVASPQRNDLGQIMRMVAEVFETGQPVSFEFWALRKNGEEFLKACVMHRGKYFGRDVLITTARDISATKATDERIREQAALLDVTQDAILVLNLKREITYFNRGAERLYGVRRAEALGCPYESIVYAEIPSGFDAEWRLLVDGAEFSKERRQVARGRGEITVQERAALVRDDQGFPKSALIVVTDITEAKRLENQFLRAQRLENLGSLASGIAHDLNNVLTPILISSGMLADAKLPAEEAELVQLLNENARRGADIVRQLLLYGRGSDSPRASMSLKRVLKDVEQIMRETFPKSISVDVQVPVDMGEIEGDRTQIHQVLLNLCVNARDAMADGGELRVWAENVMVDQDVASQHPGAKAGPHIAIHVKDNGIGIDPGHIEKIFDPFFTTKPFGQGTGLGLASVLGIVRSHGGIISVASKPGQGAIFSVFLPALEPLPVAAGEHGREGLQGKGELVLLIDDEEGVRNATTNVLKRFGYAVATANDGASAIKVFEAAAHEIRLVVTDIMMPVMDGRQAIRGIRRINPAVPVIAISGISSHKRELEEEFGPRLRFVAKPFGFDTLLAQAGELLRE